MTAAPVIGEWRQGWRAHWAGDRNLGELECDAAVSERPSGIGVDELEAEFCVEVVLSYPFFKPTEKWPELRAPVWKNQTVAGR